MAGCSPTEQQPEIVDISGPTMGTSYHVKVVVQPEVMQPGNLSRQQLKQGIDAELERINRLMSTYRKDSEISRFAAVPVGQIYAIAPETAEVIRLAQSVSRRTNGAFDITVAALVDLWGFGPNVHASKEPGSIEKGRQAPIPEQIQEQLKQIGYQRLEVAEQRNEIRKLAALRIDLSAIAKGYAVDRVAAYLQEQGLNSYLVEIGGEVAARGRKPNEQQWRIAIESPTAGQRAVQRIVPLEGVAVATSGDYRNYFEQNGVRYSHTINPLDGYPIRHSLASATVVAETAALADALATAFLVMGTEKALNFATLEGIPTLLISKAPQGFAEHASPAFERLMTENR